MPPTLLVTNDFPPRPGGIQSYLQALVERLPAPNVVVYAPAWRGADSFDARQPFEVVRHPGRLMLPVPGVRRRARELARAHDVRTVWFGASAPLALLGAGLRGSGCTSVERIVASTHGHEVGWSMVPGGRRALRRIGETTDVLTFVSRYTRNRFASAFGPRSALEHLPSGVDTRVFAPDPVARAEIRTRYALGDRPVITCVSRLVPRKGQDVLVRALPEIRERVPGAVLLLVGGGPYRATLLRLADRLGVAEHVIMTGSVPADELAAHHTVGDVFAMPCRTRGAGLDVEGLGIVNLEASASGVPVVTGRSGGAPETVRDGVTGRVVDGRDAHEVAEAVAGYLGDPDLARRTGAAGRAWVSADWRWERVAQRLAELLEG